MKNLVLLYSIKICPYVYVNKITNNAITKTVNTIKPNDIFYRK